MIGRAGASGPSSQYRPSFRSNDVGTSDEHQRQCKAKPEHDLEERDRMWQSRLERLEYDFQTSQRRLQTRIVGLEQEIGVLRSVSNAKISLSRLQSGDRFVDAIIHLSERINTLDSAANLFASDISTLQKAIDYAPYAFPQFVRLPLELREIIWGLAMPQRVHKVAKDFRGWEVKNGPPMLAHTCHESRRIAHRTGRPTAFHEVFDSGEWDRFTKEPIGRNKMLSWFDVRHDVLQVQATGKWRPSRVGDFCQVVETVLLSYDDYDMAVSCLPFLYHPAYFSNLKLIQLEMPGISLLAGQTTTIGEEEIFGRKLDVPIYADLDDEDFVQTIAENLRKRPGFRPTADDWLSSIRTARSEWYVWVGGIRFCPPADGWEGFRSWLSHYWLRTLRKNTPLSSEVIVKSSGTRKQVKWDHPVSNFQNTSCPLLACFENRFLCKQGFLAPRR